LHIRILSRRASFIFANSDPSGLKNTGILSAMFEPLFSRTAFVATIISHIKAAVQDDLHDLSEIRCDDAFNRYNGFNYPLGGKRMSDNSALGPSRALTLPAIPMRATCCTFTTGC
jgi:hypothetical protein